MSESTCAEYLFGSCNKYVSGTVSVGNRKVPSVTGKLRFCDTIGRWKSRWGIGRMRYAVDPGLYAIGSPNAGSDVIVTANYKLTFDVVRSDIAKMNAWILVLDTKGINVWCAAGKGTFGTAELIKRIISSSLSSIVSHRRIIVPQLGAPGIAAHDVKRQTGFTVVYGPVRSSDIHTFIEDGYVKDEKMSRVFFPFVDRLVLVPMEFVLVSKYIPLFAAMGILFHGIVSWSLWPISFVESGYLLFGIISGAILTPLLLPVVPVKPFSLKGFIVGVIISAVYTYFTNTPVLYAAGLSLIASALSAYLALQFTGASTYTSETGVRLEIRVSLPILRGIAIAGFVLAAGTAVYRTINGGSI